MHLAGINEWLATIASPVTAAVEWAGDVARAQLAKWSQAYADFRASLSELERTAPRTSEGATRKAALLGEARSIQEKINYIESSIATAKSWLGLGALPAIVPAVAVAAIVAVTALIYKWTDEVAAWLREERLVSSGVPRPVAQNETSTASQGLFGDAAKLAWPLALGAGVFLLISMQRGSR